MFLRLFAGYQLIASLTRTVKEIIYSLSMSLVLLVWGGGGGGLVKRFRHM